MKQDWLNEADRKELESLVLVATPDHNWISIEVDGLMQEAKQMGVVLKNSLAA